MSGNSLNTGIQSVPDSSSQTLRSRDTLKSQIAAKLSSARRSPSPNTPLGTNASHGLLSQQPSSSHVTRLSPPLGQFVINTLLQIAGFAAAIAFGIYAIQSVTVGKDANQSADVANQLALLGLCLQSGNLTGAIGSICSRVIYYAATTLPDLASTLFPNLPSAVPSSTQTSTLGPSSTAAATPTSSSNAGLNSGTGSSGKLIAIVVGTIVGVLAICLILFFWIRRRRTLRYDTVTPATITTSEKKEAAHRSLNLVQSFRRLFVETRVITEAR